MGGVPGKKNSGNSGSIHSIYSLKSFFFKILFIHLRERMYVNGGRERERARAGGGAEGEGEAGFPLSREPDMGLDPRTPGSRPEPKADA